MNKISSWLFLLVFACLPARGQAQDAYAEKLIEQYTSACKSTISAALGKLNVQISLNPKLANINDLVIFIPSADYIAITDLAAKRVMIPLHWCVETWLTTEALTEITKRPAMTEALHEYSRYLSTRQRIFRMTGNPFNQSLLLTFHDFTGLPRSSLTTPEAEKYIAAQEMVLIDALAFILAHEMGHIALDHQTYQLVTPQASRLQEYAADEFAISMLRESGISLLGALVATERFISDERRPPPIGPSHPTGECRIERIFRLGALPEVQREVNGAHHLLIRRKRIDIEEIVNRMSLIRQQCEADER